MVQQIKLASIAAVIILLAAACPLLAAKSKNSTPNEIIEGLSRRYQNLTGLQASYSRVASTPSTDQLFKGSSSHMATGMLYWSKPSKLLLEQNSPQPETMVTDGATVWWHIKPEKLVYRYKNLDVAGQMKPLLVFLSGLAEVKANFKVTQAPADKTRPKQSGLILTPKQTNESGLDKLTVWCDDNFMLTGFRLSAVTGETTDFYLTGFVENPKIDDRQFKFKVPKGVEVIEDDGEQ